MSILIPKPILLTGAHRSGSTWMGKVIGASPKTRYIHEPFNIGIPHKNSPIEHWHQAVNEFTSKDKQAEIKAYLEYFYALPKSYRDEEWAKVPEKYTKRDVFWMFRQRMKHRTIIKDPLAVFAAEWIYKTINCDVIVSIRHPAAFVASLKVKNWNTDFNELKYQTEFQHPVLKKYEDQIARAANKQPDIITTGVLLWNMIYDMVHHYKQKYQHQWQFHRHEDVSLQPINTFKEVFSNLKIPFSNAVEAYILKTTQGDGSSDYERDAKKNIFTWKKRLTQDERAQVKEETAEVWNYFYTENDW